MNKSKRLFYLATLVFFISLFLLVSGSKLLLYPLFGGQVPAGTPITWLGLIAINYMAFWLTYYREGQAIPFFRYLSTLFLILAMAWVFICYLLAGNWANLFTGSANFQGGQEAMKLFWALSYTLSIAPVVLILIYYLRKFVLKLIKKGA